MSWWYEVLLLVVSAGGLWFGAHTARRVHPTYHPPKSKPDPTPPPPAPVKRKPSIPKPSVPRTITWYRTERRPEIPLPGEDGTKPVVPFEDLGMEKVTAPALYDNGYYAVIDSVKDLLFEIVEQRDNRDVGPQYSFKSWHLVKSIPLDLDEAIQYADDLRELRIEQEYS